MMKAIMSGEKTNEKTIKTIKQGTELAHSNEG
jgi:hypothetical protein